MQNLSKNILTAGILLAFTLSSVAADTLKIHLTNKHKLNSKGQTSGYITINQKFHTPDGILFREISYNENTGQLSGYTFYFYDNGYLSTEETYNQSDSLQYIIKHEYDATGNETTLTKLIPGVTGLTVAEKTLKSYRSDRKLLQQKTYYGKQIGAVNRYQYDGSGHLIKKKSTFKPAAKATVKQETMEYSYNADTKISQVLIAGKDWSGKTFQYRDEYSYNDMGLLSSIKKMNSNNVLQAERIYKYVPSGMISIYEEQDAAGIKLLLLEYEYKKHYMDSGTQVSYYENL